MLIALYAAAVIGFVLGFLCAAMLTVAKHSQAEMDQIIEVTRKAQGGGS